MEAAEAVAKVEQWLLDAHGADSGLRADHDNVRLIPEGWSVPYNTVAFLDEGNLDQEIMPPPVLIVREPDGELRHAAPHPGGLSIPVRYPNREYWAEIVDPEYLEAGLGVLGVPPAAVAGWHLIAADGTDTGEQRENPGYITGPMRRGYPRPLTKLDHLVEFRHIGWLDQRQFVVGLLETELVMPLRDGKIHHERTKDGRREIDAWTSTRFFPPGSHQWIWLDPVTFLEQVPEADLNILGPWGLRATASTEELRDALTRFVRWAPRAEAQGHCPEAMPDLGTLAADVAARIGLAEPEPLPLDAADNARAHGFELTVDECRRVVIGRSWVRRMRMPLAPRPPAEPAAFGLAPGYDQDGRRALRVDSFGKFSPGVPETNLSWQRVLGAYVGFALGEALGLPVDRLDVDEITRTHGPAGVTDLAIAFDQPGQIGPMTQRLLFLTEAFLRAPSGAALATASEDAVRRWKHTQGETDPKIAGWLPHQPELHAQRRADPADLVGGPATLLGALPGVLSVGGTGEIPFGQSEPAVRTLSRLPGSTDSDLTASVYLGLLLERSLERGFSPALWVSSAAVLVDRQGPGWDDVREIAAQSLLGIGRRGLHHIREPEHIGSGQDALSVLGRALAAVSGFENNPEGALLRAVNHSGRSALTGAIAGALIGARNGVPELPQKWLDRLELRPLIERVVTDVTRTFTGGPEGEEGQRWVRRYPAIRA